MKNIFFVALLACCFASTYSHAESSNKSKAPPMEWTSLQKENMAKMHENMATCLRSTKTPKECHAEMKSFCKEKGPTECPMMGKKGSHHMYTE